MSEKRLRRADDGTVVSGWGSELTDLQRTFIERVQNEGLYSAARIAREMNYKSYYRDKANEGTAFHRALMDMSTASERKLEYTKGMNLDTLGHIRDSAFESGDFKMAMEAIKIMNDMKGHKAPVKVQQTKIDVRATIDLTASIDEDNDGFIDVDYEDDGD